MFLLAATADMACLSLDEVNGSFKRFVYVYFCCFESKQFVWIALCIRAIPTMTNYR